MNIKEGTTFILSDELLELVLFEYHDFDYTISTVTDGEAVVKWNDGHEDKQITYGINDLREFIKEGYYVIQSEYRTSEFEELKSELEKWKNYDDTELAHEEADELLTLVALSTSLTKEEREGLVSIYKSMEKWYA